MGNAAIPRRATEIDTEYGIAVTGVRVEAAAFHHIPCGHTKGVYWIVQYARTPAGHVDYDTRVTRQYTGSGAERRMRAEFAEIRDLLVASR